MDFRQVCFATNCRLKVRLLGQIPLAATSDLGRRLTGLRRAAHSSPPLTGGVSYFKSRALAKSQQRAKIC